VNDIPPGYVFDQTPSKYIDHMGRLFTKKVTRADGVVEAWAAMRVEPYHVNAWNFAHGSFIAGMAEIGTAQASWDKDGPPCIAIDLTIQFIGAPKLGDLLEVCGTLTKRTRTLAFTSARGEVGGVPMFTATSIQKVVNA
jgi:acyl-coenzyme A thioesterase PaaI-like protein